VPLSRAMDTLTERAVVILQLDIAAVADGEVLDGITIITTNQSLGGLPVLSCREQQVQVALLWVNHFVQIMP